MAAGLIAKDGWNRGQHIFKSAGIAFTLKTLLEPEGSKAGRSS